MMYAGQIDRQLSRKTMAIPIQKYPPCTDEGQTGVTSAFGG